jgi:hypothetical protein
MIITKELFENSHFNIGGGYDIEPLIRFTHSCSIFINLTLYLNLDEVTKWYDNRFKYSDFEVLEKTIIENFDERTHFELHPQFETQLAQSNFLDERQARDYLLTFQPAISEPQYAVVYKLHKKNVKRTILYYHCVAEGLASYIALSQNGQYAPKIISTIQTGALENPEGILHRYFSNPEIKKPSLWIRGFEPSYGPYRQYKNALIHSGLYNKVAIDFNSKYICGYSYPYSITADRHCKGFVTEDEYSKIEQMRLKPEYIHKRHRFAFSRLVNTTLFKQDDYFVISKLTRTDLVERRDKIIFWEDIISSRLTWWNRISVSNQISNLSRYLDEVGLEDQATLHIIPFCSEDEGDEYFKNVSILKQKTVTYLPNVYDFIDLKTTV